MTAAPPPILTDAVVPRPQLSGTEPCATGEKEYFHDSYAVNQPAVKDALRACRRCPLAAECRIWALANPDLAPTGIYGASTPRQRKEDRRQLISRLGDGPAYERVLRRAYDANVAWRTQSDAR
ncbi:WhiB family transcriptional regulator [Streptomyces sp. NBC_00470]|uniref:WhiB family transcriptional regulator n=1 Tax=Streptomyces sp. NBC_00470 TaxID=2975753 RepID=UPI002F913C32